MNPTVATDNVQVDEGIADAVRSRALNALHDAVHRACRGRVYCGVSDEQLLAWAAAQPDGNLLLARNLGPVALAWIRSAQPVDASAEVALQGPSTPLWRQRAGWNDGYDEGFRAGRALGAANSLRAFMQYVRGVHDGPAEHEVEFEWPFPQIRGKHVVYMAWDEADRLLYVGVTSHFLTRMGTHAEAALWNDAVRRVTFHSHLTRADANTCEAETINRRRPLFNTEWRRSV